VSKPIDIEHIRATSEVKDIGYIHVDREFTMFSHDRILLQEMLRRYDLLLADNARMAEALEYANIQLKEYKQNDPVVLKALAEHERMILEMK
jgi:hypothetical protein